MRTQLTRRDLAKVAGAGAVGVAAPASAQPSEGAATQRDSGRGFPKGFLWDGFSREIVLPRTSDNRHAPRKNLQLRPSAPAKLSLPDDKP